MTSSPRHPECEPSMTLQEQKHSTISTTTLFPSRTTSAAQSSSPSRRPPSIAPSITSVLSDATTITAPNHIQRGFKSRESYLAALHEFAESKSYMRETPQTLVGFYGTKTMDEIKSQPSLREDRRRRKEGERLSKAREEGFVMDGVGEQGAADAEGKP